MGKRAGARRTRDAPAPAREGARRAFPRPLLAWRDPAVDPSRPQRFEQLGAARFDVVVVGGGATGAGVALDAAARGLRVALLERGDLASGTSSRSTKLVHGGVRYLERAVKQADRSQFHLVREALRERAVLLRNARHLARPLALLTPAYSPLDLPYYYTGLKLYDMLAGRANLRPSRRLGRDDALRRYPMLRRDGLRGAVEYHDGQFDDARTNVALALTAAEHGALVLNHAEVTAFERSGGRLVGGEVEDRLTGARHAFAARVVVNAAGPYADAVRRLDDPSSPPLLRVSSGVHVVLPGRFTPPDTGLLVPKTEDGRVLFVLPWQGRTLAGTTDNPAPLEDDPRPREEDVEYVLRHVRQHCELPVDRRDVLASWSGLRPLVEDSESAATARLSRDHVIVTSPSGLVTVTGGKWTTYRSMAEDAVDAAVAVGGLRPRRGCATRDLPLVGAERFSPDGHARLRSLYGLPGDVALHLNRAYGDRAEAVARLARGGLGERLVPGHPYVAAEVVYARDCELACTADDVLARRLRLSFLDAAAAEAARPRVEELMALDSPVPG